MALDLAPDGILVNEVAPGYVDAGLTGQLFQKDPDLRARRLRVCRRMKQFSLKR
jgi:NAD(P)-dependent dehydrogenase (short-subunit alcohol dehydrogenase family)